jgi:hypothetical protein
MSDSRIGGGTPTPSVASPDSGVIPPRGIALGRGRPRLTQRDLDVYAALVGVPQTLLIPQHPQRQHPQGGGPPRTGTPTHATAKAPLWGADGLTARLGPPQFSSWVRRMSGQARQHLRRARARLTGAGGASRS